MTPFPYPVFNLHCQLAAWDIIAQQDDVVSWSPLRRKVTRFLCGVGMDILGWFWTWKD